MNNYYNHANIQSPCPNYIDIESLDGRTTPERRSSDDRRISWHPTATGRSPGSHRWTTCRWPSGHRPKFRSSAKWIGRPPSSRLAVAGRRPQPDLYDLVQGRENPAVICRCQKTGIGGKSADHRPILKACDAAFTWLQTVQSVFKCLDSSSKLHPNLTPAIAPTPLHSLPLVTWYCRIKR